MFERHDAREHLLGDEHGELHGVGLVELVELFGIGDGVAVLVLHVALEQVVEGHALEEFAHHVVVVGHGAVLHGRLYGEEAHHLHEVVVLDAYVRLVLGSLDDTLGEAGEHELDGHVAHLSGVYVDAPATVHLAHAALAQGRGGGVELVVVAFAFFFLSL